MRPDWQRAAARRAIVPAILLVVGLVIALTGSDLVGWTVFGVGVTLGLGLVFLEIGYSEDRARQAEDERRP